MEHVMIDIETKGTKSNSVITSIAAVCFDINTGKRGAELCVGVDEESCLEVGLLVDPKTVEWWENQPQEVKDKLKKLKQKHLGIALVDLWCFMKNNTPENVKVWGNSARFDLGLLENAADKSGVFLAWKYWNERDVRTLVSFAPKIKKNMIFKGEKHHPLHDCYHQIAYCSKIWRRLKYNWFERLFISLTSWLKKVIR
jgi:hypothetical protein